MSTVTLEELREQLGRLTAAVAKLHVLERSYGPPKLRMGLELVKLADELDAPMSAETRYRIVSLADACGVSLDDED